MKKILSMILAVAMVLSLGAFALADAPVEINFWSMWNEGEPQANVIAEAAEAFEAETGVHVNIEWKGRDLNTLITAALESEEELDLFEDDFNRLGQVDAPYTYDLTEMAEAAGYEGYPVFNDFSIKWAGYLNSIVE